MGHRQRRSGISRSLVLGPTALFLLASTPGRKERFSSCAAAWSRGYVLVFCSPTLQLQWWVRLRWAIYFDDPLIKPHSKMAKVCCLLQDALLVRSSPVLQLIQQSTRKVTSLFPNIRPVLPADLVSQHRSLSTPSTNHVTGVTCGTTPCVLFRQPVTIVIHGQEEVHWNEVTS